MLSAGKYIHVAFCFVLIVPFTLNNLVSAKDVIPGPEPPFVLGASCGDTETIYDWSVSITQPWKLVSVYIAPPGTQDPAAWNESNGVQDRMRSALENHYSIGAFVQAAYDVWPLYLSGTGDVYFTLSRGITITHSSVQCVQEQWSITAVSTDEFADSSDILPLPTQPINLRLDNEKEQLKILLNGAIDELNSQPGANTDPQNNFMKE